MKSSETFLPKPAIDIEDINIAAARLRASKLGHFAALENYQRDNFKNNSPETVFSIPQKKYFGAIALSQYEPATSSEFILPTTEK